MTSSSARLRSPRPAVHAARDIDEMLAAEWALDDFAGPGRPLPEGEAEPADPEAEARAAALALAAETAARALAEAEMAAERDRLVAEAYAQGYEEGRAEGEEAEAARLAHAVRAAGDALEELRAGEVRWAGTIEENVCALAVAVARHVLGRELKEDPEAVAELVRRALAEFPVDQPLRVRVNPTDLAAITALREPDGTPAAVTQGRDAHWLADPQVQPGGCLVEGRDRIVDGRVDTALERLYRRLTYTGV